MTTMRSTTFSTTLLGERGGARRLRLVDEGLDDVVLVLLVVDELALQRLRELGAVAVERVGLEAELPGQQVRRLAVLDGGVVRHVDGLGDGAGDERLRRRQHADVALDREIALAGAAARIGAVEHRVVLGLEVRRAFDRHGAADVDVGGVDLALGEAERGEQVEARIVAAPRDRRRAALTQNSSPSVHLLNANLMSKAVGSAFSTLRDRLGGEALGLQRRVVDAGRLAERAVADRIGLDLGDVAIRE